MVFVEGGREGEGEVCLLAAADMVFVSLLPRSIDRCRNVERDLDLVRMIDGTSVSARPAAEMASRIRRKLGAMGIWVTWRRKRIKRRLCSEDDGTCT